MTQQRISTLSIWNQDQSDAVALVIGRSMSQEDAAKVLGIERKTVQRRLQSAYEDVRVMLEDDFDVVVEIPIYDVPNLCTPSRPL